MSEVLAIELTPDISHIITEDDTPVDNIFSAKQQRLLVESLYSSWQSTVPFLVCANVGLFYSRTLPPFVPDVFLSLDVSVTPDWRQKENRAYFVWEFGKPPELVIEIVSNKVGNELGKKLRDYARIGIGYYVVLDPFQQLGETRLQVYELQGIHYVSRTETWLEDVGLGLTLWRGVYEGVEDTWLRWCDVSGNMIPTGAERAAQAEERARQAEEQSRRLADQLRSAGIEPEV
ncbi:Uma2 family endonuclease [Argonema antarcticum]|uniref:Uma2 family endonuclease n=1 Tax=Argonema antarcticum TaxID=2942763 RepID=UPI0020114628|nr:Uma2 family endonuclease [Argonema antarcticum]MCL1470929.1 Uma2 family endonuclease [Argonema antarcticum A004/B2]